MENLINLFPTMTLIEKVGIVVWGVVVLSFYATLIFGFSLTLFKVLNNPKRSMA
jgi:hypothetical protein